MPPQNAKSLMKEFRASFRRKKVTDTAAKEERARELEEVELAKLVELKENFGDQLPPLYTDDMLVGFLRAKSLNVKEAEDLVKVDVNMRHILRIEEFQQSELIKEFAFSGIIGFDKEGSLVRVLNVGFADFKAWVHSVSTIEIFKSLIWMVEKDMKRQEAENKRTGRRVNSVVFVMNMENLNMGQITYKPTFDTAFLALRLLQDHFQNLLKTLFIVNAPSFFSSVFKLFKPVIDDSLHKRIRILDNCNWKEELLKHIDADILPVYLGGNRIDINDDPKCSEIIKWGGVIPESRYANNFLDPEDPNVVVATVPAGSYLNFRFPVHKVGTVVRWHIQAKDNDIAIALYKEPLTTGIETPRTQHRKRKEEDMSRFERLTPVIRSQCQICPEVGSTIMWMTGNLILNFDNSYSWMNAKEVHFVVTLEPPKETEKNYMNAMKSLKKMSLRN